MDLKEALEKGYIIKEDPDPAIVKKELLEADYDLKKAKDSFRKSDYKWAIVQAYYAMFHSARAVLFWQGLREKRHFVIPVVLEQLSNEGKIEQTFIDDFKTAIFSREEADYHYGYSKETAILILQIAERFIQRMNKMCS